MLTDRVLRTIRRHELIPAGGRVLAAVSGGPDSIALAHVLSDLQRAGRFTLAGLAHLNHRLRGEASDADERFCRSAAAKLGVPIDVESADVAARASEWGASIEAAGRRARYEFLERAARRLGAVRVAVGHTRTDQAETFLLRLLRGAGPRGLGGIHPRVGPVIRPLIDATRGEVVDYLKEHGIAWREDESNADVAIPRNRVRHELIPFLADRFTPGIVDVLAREAAVARDDDEWLEQRAIEIAPTIVLDSSPADAGRFRLPQPGGLRLDARALSAAPVALARRVLRDALQAVSRQESGPGFEHIDAVLGLEIGQSVDVPGVHAKRRGAEIVLEPGTRRAGGLGSTAPGSNSFQYRLSIPGEVQVAEAGWIISAEKVDAGLRGPRPEGLKGTLDTTVMIQAAGLGAELRVRSREPGDALRPVGLGGRKKLQDLFVDRKVAREERDRVPLVVDPSNRIVWVVGHTVAEDFRVTEPAAGVILLKARRLGGRD